MDLFCAFSISSLYSYVQVLDSILNKNGSDVR